MVNDMSNNTQEIDSEAPGKLLLFGPYPLLQREKSYRCYVVPLDCFVHVHITPRKDNVVKINAPQFEAYAEGTVDTSTGNVFVSGPESLNLVTTAIDLSLTYVKALGRDINGFEITTRNDDAFVYRIKNPGDKKAFSKSGLGSSSAAIVATVGGILTAFGADVKENDCLYKLSQLTYVRTTGKAGYGFDIATAVFGPIQYSLYPAESVENFPRNCSGRDVLAAVKKDWGYSVEPLPFPTSFKLILANFINEATITDSFVKKVNEFKKTYPTEYNHLINKINSAVILEIYYLKKINAGDRTAHTLDALRSAFNEERALTKTLGEKSGVEIESADSTALINEACRIGAFAAKLPGAGGRDSIVALSDSEHENGIRKLWRGKPNLDVLELKPGSTGFSVKKVNEANRIHV